MRAAKLRIDFILMLPDAERVAAIIRDVAAAEILPRFRKLTAADVRHKGPGDLVTIADEAAEQALARRLSELLPGSVVVGEEAAAVDAGLITRIAGAPAAWIIDPIDGTANFAAGRPTFGVIVALAMSAETRAGWIYDPCGDRMATAVKGEGAWLGDARLKAAGPAAPFAMTGAVSTRCLERPLRQRVRERARGLGGAYSLGCAAHEYLRLSAGDAHFALYGKIMPWDHATGALMHAEAGGFQAKLDGSAYGPAAASGGLLLAPDRASWTMLRDFLFAPEEGDHAER
jgi:fructose-1,6-bisphosphatase/inositol monophosphatase family enzyme